MWWVCLQYYPEPCALDTVPFGKSIACSTPEAVAWDPEWEKSTGDISGRAVAVHDSSSGFKLAVRFLPHSIPMLQHSEGQGSHVFFTLARVRLWV